MKKFLQCLGTLVYSLIASYLLYLLCAWITPFVMGANWLLFLVFIFVGMGIIGAIIGFASQVLAVPMVLLTSNNMVAKIINMLPFLFFGFLSVCMPWQLDIQYKFLQVLIAISLSLTYLVTFGMMIIAAFSIDE